MLSNNIQIKNMGWKRLDGAELEGDRRRLGGAELEGDMRSVRTVWSRV